MWEPDYDKQAKYWMEKDAVSNKLDPEKLKKRIDSFICERKTCVILIVVGIAGLKILAKD